MRFLFVGDGRALDSLKNTIQQRNVEEYFSFFKAKTGKYPSILAGRMQHFCLLPQVPCFQKQSLLNYNPIWLAECPSLLLRMAKRTIW